MYRKLRNNKGSTLLLLVIAMAIISILGTSVLGVTMMNLRVKKTNTEIKESFYLSESGLDKAYDATYSLVIDAINKSNKNTQIFLQQFTYEKLFMLTEKSKNGEFDDDLIFVKDTDGDSIKDSYDEDAIQERAKSIFTNYFYKYVTESNYGENHSNIVKLLKEISSNPKIIINDISYNGINLTIDQNDDFSNDGGLTINEGDLVNIEIKSISNPDGFKKTTSVILSIEIPEYNAAYTISSSMFSSNSLFLNNVLTTKEIEKDKNINYIPNDSYFITKSIVVDIGENEFINIVDGIKYNSNDIPNIPDDGTHKIILITDKNIDLSVHQDGLNLNGLIITSGEIFIKTTGNPNFNFKGIMVSGVKFKSQTGSGDVNLEYDDDEVMEIIDKAIVDGLATDELKNTINNISEQIYKNSMEQNKITIKNSTEINNGVRVSDLIEFSNWRNK